MKVAKEPYLLFSQRAAVAVGLHCPLTNAKSNYANPFALESWGASGAPLALTMTVKHANESLRL